MFEHKKRVMYMIGTLGHGRGGHFYSLRTTAEALNGTIKPFVVNIGKNNSPVIDSAEVPKETVLFNGWNIIKTIRSLVKLVKEEKIDIIHTFDTRVAWFGRFLSVYYKIPIIHTVCGGPNPVEFSSHIKYCILYSQENLDYVQNIEKFKDVQLYLIPNRVGISKIDVERINLIKKSIKLEGKTFLRIARFDSAYKKSMVEAIDLIQYLNQKNLKTQLILIGAIENSVVYEEILAYIRDNFIENIYVLTDDIFTINASELIEVADFIIGTGRGLMEAASQNKIILTPVKDSEFPILVNKDNFMSFFSTNFSPRNAMGNNLKNENIEHIVDVLKNINSFKKAKRNSEFFFKEYFYIDSKKNEYEKIYKNLEYQGDSLFNFEEIKSFLRTIKRYIR